MITHVFVLLVLLLLTVEKTEAIGQEYCQDGSTFLEATAIGNCFALVDIREGPVPMEQASDKCDTRFSGGKLVNVMSKEELEIILNWAINHGLPNDTNSGFWTAWKRDLPAPAELNGLVTKTNQDIRKDRELFKLPWRWNGGRPMDSIWRNETQPGNTLDQRDEMCTAQSRPGKQPEFLGIDDYECNGTTLHYIVCQVPMVNDDYE
ncbi:uncharacterized protein LOC142348703 [Convolutriloba macropyga]|uniref:uncharacterized protein LOC142348703 n=1 Tax=Convolutriloba macropyga TaxID=536237 RepID=UPI003F52612B